MDLPIGFRFCPSEEELLTYYLAKKVNNENFPDPTHRFQDHQLYNFSPQQLSERYGLLQRETTMYIFNKRELKYSNGNVTKRNTPNGFWKNSVKKKTITVGNHEIGFKMGFEYREGEGHGSNYKTNWLMYEYSLPQTTQWVLCKVYQKKEAKAKAKAKATYQKVVHLPCCPSNQTDHSSQPIASVLPQFTIGNNSINRDLAQQSSQNPDSHDAPPQLIVVEDKLNGCDLQVQQQSSQNHCSQNIPLPLVKAVENNSGNNRGLKRKQQQSSQYSNFAKCAVPRRNTWQVNKSFDELIGSIDFSK